LDFGEIVRIKEALGRTFTYIGLDIGFEFTLGSGKIKAAAPEDNTSLQVF
jgi:hypothetical protein